MDFYTIIYSFLIARANPIHVSDYEGPVSESEGIQSRHR